MIKLTKGNLLKSDAEALTKKRMTKKMNEKKDTHFLIEKKDTHFLIKIFGCPVLFFWVSCFILEP